MFESSVARGQEEVARDGCICCLWCLSDAHLVRGIEEWQQLSALGDSQNAPPLGLCGVHSGGVVSAPVNKHHDPKTPSSGLHRKWPGRSVPCLLCIKDDQL